MRARCHVPSVAPTTQTNLPQTTCDATLNVVYCGKRQVPRRGTPVLSRRAFCVCLDHLPLGDRPSRPMRDGPRRPRSPSPRGSASTGVSRRSACGRTGAHGRRRSRRAVGARPADERTRLSPSLPFAVLFSFPPRPKHTHHEFDHAIARRAASRSRLDTTRFVANAFARTKFRSGGGRTGATDPRSCVRKNYLPRRALHRSAPPDRPPRPVC